MNAHSPSGIDPRGPRFGAAITATLLLITVGAGLETAGTPAADLATRVSEFPFVLLTVLSALFLWGFIGGITRHPYGAIFKKIVRPRLSAPEFLESAAGPTFAQGVGFVVTAVGVVLHISGVPFGLVGAAGAAFIAAFLNSVFAYCLGCEIYLVFAKRGITFGLDRRFGGTPAEVSDPQI
ncbi:uncharacterized protein DUF4395 [Microbacteriaceae bacterium MWH-Ta3]|nr:uncharacterized protein DUF4395 [Microbacteriaceae bacterium MWH-Ta3]